MRPKKHRRCQYPKCPKPAIPAEEDVLGFCSAHSKRAKKILHKQRMANPSRSGVRIGSDKLGDIHTDICKRRQDVVYKISREDYQIAMAEIGAMSDQEREKASRPMWWALYPNRLYTKTTGYTGWPSYHAGVCNYILREKYEVVD